MRAPRIALSLLLTSAVLLPPGADAQKSVAAYRWVDEQGVVHYGDSIPPQYAEKAHELLNKQGVQVGHEDAQKTPEQLAEEARNQAEALKRKQHDSFLVATYTSVKDIESLRDERLSQIQAQQTAAQQYVQSLQSRLTALQGRAQQFKPYSSQPNAPRMPDDLAQELVQTLSEVRVQDQAIQARTEQEAQVKAQFQSDIERFEQLKAAPP